jgi:hypothetical protein
MPNGTKRREDLCKKYFYAISSKSEEVQRFIAAPMCCKSWDCPSCRAAKSRDYVKRMQTMWSRPKLFFLTLTYFHSITPDEAWSTYNAAWNRLRTNLSKQFGTFNYVRVLESHNKSAYPHLHLITDKRFPDAKFGPAALAAGFGYQIKQRPITTDGARFYISKYLTKEWKNEEGWRLRKKYRCRIISFSRGLMSPKMSGGNWNSLLVGSTFSECIERIYTEVGWSLNPRLVVRNELIEENYAEITVDWCHEKENTARTDESYWQPDDWLPK